MQKRKKKNIIGSPTEYDILLNNSATERNIEMKEVIIRMFSWSVYVLKTFIEKSYKSFITKYRISL